MRTVRLLLFFKHTVYVVYVDGIFINFLKENDVCYRNKLQPVT